MNKELIDKIAVVTGAGRGIGRAIAIAFAKEGANLFLAARTWHEINDTAAICRDVGGKEKCIVTDIANWDQVQELIGLIIKEAGRLDILVNAAGIYGPIGPSAEVNLLDWKRAVEINLIGPFYLCRAAIPYMISQKKGKIILLGGGGATNPLPCFSSYAASKAGLARLADTLAEELRPYNVQVNVIAPGLVDTKLQDVVLQAREKAGALYEKILLARETGKGAVSPDIAAELAVFLASEASGKLTGKLISAPYDPWREWAGKGEKLNASPMFTIRRLDPFTIKPLIKDLT